MSSIRAAIAVGCSLLCSTAQAIEPPEGAYKRWDPPARYAGEYSGGLRIIRIPQTQVNTVCQGLMGDILKGEFQKYGCAWWQTIQADADLGEDNPWVRFCIVILMEEVTDQISPAALLDHEMGHCNGWPADHPE